MNFNKKLMLTLTVLSTPFVCSEINDTNVAQASNTGWQKTGNFWYYLENNGTIAKNVWKGHYYLGSNGLMVTNAWTPDGYYVDANGKWVQSYGKKNTATTQTTTVNTGWKKNSYGQWIFYNNDGSLAKNIWKGNYYLGANGIMLTNTWTPDGYYVDANGKWVQSYGKKNTATTQATTVNTGWKKNSYGQWIFYNNDGSLAKNVWKGNYYLGANGIMLTNTWTPDGYYVDANGKWVQSYGKKNNTQSNTSTVEVTTTQTVNNNNHVVYFAQNDKRWANKYYGRFTMASTGCVPTSIAMIFNTYGVAKTPVNIADEIYNETTYFNKIMLGTMTEAVAYMANKYGFSYSVITSNEQLKEELAKGRTIYAAVDGLPFITPGYSHGIVLRGIDSDGRTTVYNPHLSRGVAKKYKVDFVWNHGSKDKDNLGLGSPFIAISK